MTTQATLWGADERVETIADIVKRGMRIVNADGVSEEQYNITVVWLAMLEYPSLWELFEFAANARRFSKGDDWKGMVRDFLLESAKARDLPNTESLNRGCRELKRQNRQFQITKPVERLARTL